MRTLLLVLSLALILLYPSALPAGPNAGGVLLVHYDANTPVPTEHGFVEASLSICDSAVVEAPSDSTILWHIYAAFPPNASPRLKVVTFGCNFDADSVAILWSATRPGATQIFFPDAGSWPYTGSGSAIGFDEALTGTVDEIYTFAGYGYGGQTFSVVAHPDQGGTMADDDSPSHLDEIADYGSLGFGLAGSVACPEIGGGLLGTIKAVSK